MGPRPEVVDMTVLAERIRPLAHQASVGLQQASAGLHQASEDLRQTLDHAGDAIAARAGDGWPGTLRQSPVLLAVVSRLRQPLTLGDVTWGVGRWLLLATVVAVLTALGAAAIAQVVRSRRTRLPDAAPAAAPVVIPVSVPPTEAGSSERPVETLRSA